MGRLNPALYSPFLRVSQPCHGVGHRTDLVESLYILVGLLSTMTCFVIWGMSTSLTVAIMVRAIMGGGNGNGMQTSPISLPFLSPASRSALQPFVADAKEWVLFRTMVAELVPEKELQPMAFSHALVWSIGSVFWSCVRRILRPPRREVPRIFLGTASSSGSIPSPCQISWHVPSSSSR